MPVEKTGKRAVAQGNWNPWNRGIKTGKRHPLSKETKQKMSLALKGKKSWNEGLKMPKEYCEKLSRVLKDRYKDKNERLGEKNPSWRGGIKHSKGYLLTRVGCQKYYYSHRIVVENSLGRKLDPKEVVHHKNGIRNDNRLENLQVMSSIDHLALHRKLKKEK